MRVSDIIMLSIAAALTAYLLLRHWQRAKRRLPDQYWTGHGIDLTGITGRVQRARDDFASVSHLRAPDIGQRRAFVASARQVVALLSYFRRRQSEASAERD